MKPPSGFSLLMGLNALFRALVRIFMKNPCLAFVCALAVLTLGSGCVSTPKETASKTPVATQPTESPLTAKAQAEVETRYHAARPEIQEYVLWTARSFGPGALWLPEDAFASLPPEAREQRIVYLVTLF